MPTKEEAEAMAEAILATHRQPADAVGAATPRRRPVAVAFILAGALAGALAAALPAHSWVIGAVIGASFAAIAGAFARRD